MQTAALRRIEALPRAERMELLTLLERRDLPKSLTAYVKRAWAVIEPETPLSWNWHHDVICEHLEAATRGEISRLVINVPPGYTKSNLVTVLWPTWVWASKPASRWIFSSYDSSLSTKHSLFRRDVIESDWYQERWGHRVELASDQNVKTEFSNTARGSMYATSTGGSATGHHGEFIIEDDPHNPKKAESDVQREEAIKFHDRTLATRFSNPSTSVWVLIMQRLHATDLTGHVLERGGWTHVCLPAEYESRHPHVFAGDRRKKDGELLWPQQYGPAAIRELKKDLGSYGYAGQEQQRPSAAEGGMLKRAWWKYWKVPPATFDIVVQSWDFAFKDSDGSDYVVGQVWGKKGAEIFLLDQVRGHMDFPESIAAILNMSKRWAMAGAKLVEDKANGPAVIDSLKKKVSGLLAREPKGSKEARVSASSPFAEAGNVHLPDPARAPWVTDFIEECAAFPRGAHDDQVDAFTQAVIYLLIDGVAAPWGFASVGKPAPKRTGAFG